MKISQLISPAKRDSLSLFTLILSFFFTTTLFLTSCSAPTTPENSVTPIPPTVKPTVVVTDRVEGIALAFYRAWEGEDYLGMYSLLTPESQSLINSDVFIERYKSEMDTAKLLSVHTQPLSILQEGTEAQFGVRVTLETAVVGTITRDYTVQLAYQNNRWGIVWHEGLILPELKAGTHLELTQSAPARATIYDRNGSSLAYDGDLITLGIIPGQLQDETALLTILSSMLDISADEIKAKYANALPDWYIPIGTVSEEIMQANLTALQPFFDKGFTNSKEKSRIYPENGVAPHLLGYIGQIPTHKQEEYANLGYAPDDLIGVTGIELWGEKYLSGIHQGRLDVVSNSGTIIATVQEIKSVQPRSIYTSFDQTIQKDIEQILNHALYGHPIAQKGAIVVFDVNTGEIVSMASYPTYDPSLFNEVRPDNDAINSLLNNSQNPLINRATQGEYPPASTFKLVTASASMLHDIIKTDSRYTCKGYWDELGEELIKYDWLEKGHGSINLREAIIGSCNPYFFETGYLLDQIDPNLLPNTARAFGFGEPTNIIGIQEGAGLIPDPNWKSYYLGEGWAPGDSVNMSIGQGFVLVTPLQMARMIGAIANGGTLYRPTLISAIGPGGGAPRETIPVQPAGQLPINSEQLLLLQQSMRDVVKDEDGTAYYPFEKLVVPVAGKTGTAEAANFGPPHSWFVGYFPAEPFPQPDGTIIAKPQYAVVVFVENAGEGSEVAAPIFRRVTEYFYDIYPYTPYIWEGG